MSRIRTLIAVGAVAGSITLFVGCAAPADAPEQTVTVREGLTVTAADEAAGRLAMDFRKDGRVIHFELLLGPEMEAKAETAEDEMPTFQADARVTDANGATFYMQRGGDAFLDPSWRMEPVENVDVPGRMKDLELPAAALAELRALELSPRLSELKKHAIQIGLAATESNAKQEAEAPPPTVPSEEPSLGTKATTIYHGSAGRWDYVIHYMGVVGGFHSAVRLRAWTSGGSFLASYNACNHGRCASSMTTYCTMRGWLYDNGSHRRAFYSDTTTGGIFPNGACGTWWGVANGQHLCNADSLVERDSIWTNSNKTGHIQCYTGSSTAWTVPGCH